MRLSCRCGTSGTTPRVLRRRRRQHCWRALLRRRTRAQRRRQRIRRRWWLVRRQWMQRRSEWQLRGRQRPPSRTRSPWHKHLHAHKRKPTQLLSLFIVRTREQLSRGRTRRQRTRLLLGRTVSCATSSGPSLGPALLRSYAARARSLRARLGSLRPLWLRSVALGGWSRPLLATLTRERRTRSRTRALFRALCAMRGWSWGGWMPCSAL